MAEKGMRFLGEADGRKVPSFKKKGQILRSGFRLTGGEDVSKI